MSTRLIGDGVHDDTAAIQALLDSGRKTVYLPPPSVCYRISRCLKIHSHTELRLDRLTTIRLAPQSNCLMLENAESDAEDIHICGGIWDFNNREQRPNPLVTSGNFVIDKAYWLSHPTRYDEAYLGVVIRLSHVEGLSLRSLTIKDPVTFGIQMAYIRNFTVDDITFDYNYGNPTAENMDGVHLDGGCRFGQITNLKGACYDDLLALNADDFCHGPIEDIAVDGIFAEDCHSAVRLLSARSPVRRISIRNVFGTYYQYGVQLSRFYDYEKAYDGIYDGITLSNLYLSKAPRHPVYHRDDQDNWPLILINSGLRIGHLQISSFHRMETSVPATTIGIFPDTEIERLSLSHCTQQNETGGECPFLCNEGSIHTLHLCDVQPGKDTLLTGNGLIRQIEKTPNSVG